MKTIRSRGVRLSFPGLGDPEKVQVIAFGDASHANLPSGASQGARVSERQWTRTSIHVAVKETESGHQKSVGIRDVADCGYTAAVIVKEVFAFTHKPMVKCFTDSQSLVDHPQTSHVFQSSKTQDCVGK